MPDENQTSTGIIQTSQDDQVTQNQTWIDFVLDFWDEGVDSEVKSSTIETANLWIEEDEKEENLNSVDVNFDDNIFDEEKDRESQNTKQDNEKTEDLKENNDFDTQSDKNFNETQKEIGSGENIEWENNIYSWKENESEVLLDSSKDQENEVGRNESEEIDNDEVENEVMENTNEVTENTDTTKTNWDIVSIESIENNESVNDETFELNKYEWGNSEDKTSDNILNNEQNNNTTLFLDREEGKDNSNDNLSEKEESTDIISKNDINLSQNDNINNFELSINDENIPLEQPKIWDLLKDYSENYSTEDTEDKNVGNNNSEGKEYNNEQNSSEVFENNDTTLVENNENSESKQSENNILLDDYHENQNLTTINNEVDENLDDKSEEKQEWWIEMNVKTNIIDGDNYTETTNVTENVTSTLSLDQILDTELNSNPQFADNSKAVPINVQNSKGLFGNKKIMWLVGWFWLFLLAWMVVALAFPSNNTSRDPWSVVASEVVEEDLEEHQVAEPSEDLKEDFDENSVEDEWNITPHATQTTIQQDFPEVEREDDYSSWEREYLDWQWWKPEPYVCDGNDCLGEMQIDKFEIWDIVQFIQDIKLKAEIYYSQWDELQDKKLIKYALQAMHLCNNYQEQIESWQGMDEESFLTFKTEWELLLNKMEKYLIGEEYTEVAQNSNNENEELRNYIYDRENYY